MIITIYRLNSPGNINKVQKKINASLYLFSSVHYSTGYYITLHYASKNVHENGFYFIIGCQDFESLHNLFKIYSIKVKYNLISKVKRVQ